MINKLCSMRALMGALLMCVAGGVSLQADWTVVDLPGETQRPQDMTYYNGLFVAVGYSGEIATSTDGAVWTLAEVAVEPVNGFLPAFRAVAASGDLIVAVGDSGVIATSTNGTEWTAVQEGELGAPGYSGIAYGNSLFVASEYDKNVSYSSDGSTWTTVEVVTDPNAFYNFAGIAYTGEVFVAVPQTGDVVYTSTNGTDWDLLENMNLSPFGYVQRVRFAGDSVYAVGAAYDAGYVPAIASAASEAGFSFYNITGGSFGGGLADVTEGPDGQIVAVGGEYEVGTTLLNQSGNDFAGVVNDLPNTSNAIVYADGLWVVVGEGFAAYTGSIDGGGGSTPYLVQGATELGGGWYASWQGDININSWPWVFSGIGWYYAGTSGNTNENGWYFMTAAELNCWLWAAESNFPWVYCQPTGQAEGWWYVDNEQEDYTYFFSGTGAVVAVPDAF